MLEAYRSNQVLLKVVLKLCKIEHQTYRITLMHLMSVRNKIHICILSFCM